MTAAVLAPPPVFQFFGPNGTPLAYGKLYTYAAGTSTPIATYPSASEATPNTNPIILSSFGTGALWLDPATSYKFNLTDSNGNQIAGFPVDNITGGFNSGAINTNLVPAISNTYTLGTQQYTWANLYLGATGAPVLSTSANLIGWYGQTLEELALLITPTNYAYPPGNFYRYGAKGGAFRLSDGTITASSAVITSPSGGFANAVAGMICVVVDGGSSRTGGRPAPLITTIGSVQSANQITLNATVTQPGTITMTGTLSSDTTVSSTSVNPITAGVGLIRTWTITGIDIPANTLVSGISSSTLTLSQAATGSGSQTLTLTATIEVCFGWDDSAAILAAASLPYPIVPVVDNFLMTQPLSLGGSGCNDFTMPPGSLLIFAIANNNDHCVTATGFDRFSDSVQGGFNNGMRYTPFQINLGEIDCCNTGLDGFELLQSNFSTIKARVTNPFRNALGEWFTVAGHWQEGNIVDISAALAGLHFHHKVNKSSVYQNLGGYRLQGRECGLNSVYLGINATTQAAQCGGGIRIYAGGSASADDGGINQNTWGPESSCELDCGRQIALSYGSDVCNSAVTFVDASQNYVIEGNASAHYSNQYQGNYFEQLSIEDTTSSSDTRGGYQYYAMIAPTSTTLLSPTAGPWGQTNLNETWLQGSDNLTRWIGAIWYAGDIVNTLQPSGTPTTIGNTTAFGQATSLQTISTNGATITTADLTVAIVTMSASYTGIIMQAGTTPGQICIVINQSAGADSLTMAAYTTSNVADGTSCVIVGLTQKTFVWDALASLWYHS